MHSIILSYIISKYTTNHIKSNQAISLGDWQWYSVKEKEKEWESQKKKKQTERVKKRKTERQKDRNKKRVRETMKIPKDRKTEDITLSEISIYLQRRLKN